MGAVFHREINEGGLKNFGADYCADIW